MTKGVLRMLSSIGQAVFLLTAAGCGGGQGLENLSGTVNFDGRPLVFGEARFIATTEGEQSGSGYATIHDGKYDTAIEGRGVVFGEHEVRITGYAAEPAAGGEDEVAASALDGSDNAPLFYEYPVIAEIDSSTYDIHIPAEAAGYDANTQAATAGANAP